ncbi:MAG: ATP-binding protein [Bacteroidota bacterium]
MATSTLDQNSQNAEMQTFANEQRMVSALELIIARVRLRAMLRVAWLRKLWKDHGNVDGQTVNYHQAIDCILWNKDNTADEVQWLSEQEDLKALRAELEEVETTLLHAEQSFFTHLKKRLGVGKYETDVLQATLALALVPELGQVYAYLQDHSGRNYVTDELINRLFRSTARNTLSPIANLLIWDLVHKKTMANGEPPRYECDPHILNRLMGRMDIDPVLLGVAYIQAPQAPLPNWPMQPTLDFITRTLAANSQQEINICVSGAPGQGRRTFAATLCQQLQLPLLVVDVDRVSREQWPAVYLHAQRHAYLDNCALAWIGEDWEGKAWPQITRPFQIQFTITQPGSHHAPIAGMIDYRVELPAFSIQDRQIVWKRLLPQMAEWSAKETVYLINRFQVTVGQIRTVAQRATADPAEAAQLLSRSSRHRFGKLAQYLECPFNWEDLVLYPWLKNQLSDFIFEGQERELVWEMPQTRRLFPQGKGLMALFSGPPGTGKTMAAQVIAATLGVELYRIDLSTIVSKYIGETTKNLDLILNRARQLNAVLLFDECDALFGKRTEIKDAHDRYANTDTNYLLQAIESYAGIAILTTNKKANIDPGFIRRLRFVLEFQKPDAEQRYQLWQRILGELAGEAEEGALDGDLRQLAQLMPLTGAQIKNTCLSALFLSRKEGSSIQIKHLLQGLERELIKEGRSLSKDVKSKFLKS